ncbi:MAG: hypothetical protein JOZ47_11655 [Kutzneria sp.]|nr:hypothetical protein [Kutzneria sp.]
MSYGAIWALSRWMDSPASSLHLAPLALAVGVAVASGGLRGFDRELDRTAAISWPPLRTLHVTAIGVVVVGALAAVQSIGGYQLVSNEVVLRDGIGLTGLAALGVTVLGTQLAWVPPVVLTVVTMLVPPADDAWTHVITWLVQPSDVTAAAVAAVVLGLGGTLAYVAVG